MLLSIARVPSENSGQNVPPAVGEPVADRHGNIGAVIGRPAAPRMILSVHSRGISEAAGASPSEGGPDADTVSGRQGRRRQPLAQGCALPLFPERAPSKQLRY
jgi:hypothetical protein